MCRVSGFLMRGGADIHNFESGSSILCCLGAGASTVWLEFEVLASSGGGSTRLNA